jgi:hypothetical protein
VDLPPPSRTDSSFPFVPPQAETLPFGGTRREFPAQAGQKVARYVSERDDHYFFAETFDLLAKSVRSGLPPAGGWSDPPPTVREEIYRRRGLFWREV